jgi:hypothetical protein
MKKLFLIISLSFISVSTYLAYRVYSQFEAYQVPFSNIKYVKLWMLRDIESIYYKAWPTRLESELGKNNLLNHTGDFPSIQSPIDYSLLNYLDWENAITGYPRPVMIDDSNLSIDLQMNFTFLVDEAISRIPKKILSKVSDKMRGFYFIKALGSSGFTSTIYGGSGDEVAAYLFVDYDQLSKKANIWASEKDQSAFKPGPYSVKIKLTDELASDQEQKIATITNLLLHEFAHILTIGRSDFPLLSEGKVRTNFKGHDFLSLDWKIDENRNHVKNKKGFEDIFFYKDEAVRRKNEDYSDVYKTLRNSEFVSLYATTGAHEDFAESFAIYVYCKILGGTYNTQITLGGNEVLSFDSCILTDRCPEKLRIIEEFYNQL